MTYTNHGRLDTATTMPPTDQELEQLWDMIYRNGDIDTPTYIEFARAVLERWSSKEVLR